MPTSSTWRNSTSRRCTTACSAIRSCACWSRTGGPDKLDPKAFRADEIARRIDARKLQELKYYNGETHEGVFALPNYVRDLVTPARLKQPARGRRLGVVSAAAK